MRFWSYFLVASALLGASGTARGVEDPVGSFLEELRDRSAEEFAALKAYEPPRRSDQHFLCMPVDDRRAKPAAVGPSTWRDFEQARRRRAALRLDYARSAATRGQFWTAYLQLWLAHRDDPANADIRSRIGIRADSGLNVRRGRANRSDVGWPAGSYIAIRTQHFTVESRAEREEAEALAAQLESIYWIWTQAFFPFWSDGRGVMAALQGEGSVELARRAPMRIVLFPDRSHYLQALRQVPGIEQSHGYYSTEAQATLMYAGSEADRATQFHEVTHQLFSQATHFASARDVGRDVGFWVVEGLACYMESLRFYDDYATVGGWESPRLQYARYRVLQQHDEIDRAMTSVGSKEADQLDDLATWYGRAALLVHWMLDGDDPELRSRFLDYAEQLYRGAEKGPFKLTADANRSLREFVQVEDADIGLLPTTATIEKLCLGRTAVTAAGLDRLDAQLQLAWLDLSGLDVGDAAIGRLLDAGSDLRQLNLEATQISDAIAPHLARQSQLEELDVSFTGVGDPLVAALSGLHQLRIVWLTGTDISNASAPVLARLPALRSVDVQQTGVDEAGLEQLTGNNATLEVNPLVLAPTP